MHSCSSIASIVWRLETVDSQPSDPRGRGQANTDRFRDIGRSIRSILTTVPSVPSVPLYHWGFLGWMNYVRFELKHHRLAQQQQKKLEANVSMDIAWAEKHYFSNLPVFLISTYQWCFCPFKFDFRFMSTLVIERTLRCKCPRCNRSANTKWWGMKASCKGHWFAHSTSREQCVWVHTPRSTDINSVNRSETSSLHQFALVSLCRCRVFLRDTTFFSLVHASFWEDLRRSEKWIWRVSRVWRCLKMDQDMRTWDKWNTAWRRL